MGLIPSQFCLNQTAHTESMKDLHAVSRLPTSDESEAHFEVMKPVQLVNLRLLTRSLPLYFVLPIPYNYD